MKAGVTEMILRHEGRVFLVSVRGRACVSRRGGRWGWSCPQRKAGASRCGGGLSDTPAAATAAALRHLVAEHSQVRAVVTADPDGCQMCDRPADRHQHPPQAGGHAYIAPTPTRRKVRLSAARKGNRMAPAELLAMITDEPARRGEVVYTGG